MALSTLDKVKIVTDLGYAAKSVYPGSILYTNWIDDRLTNLEAEIETCVRDMLRRLKDADKKLEKALCRAGISKVDNITFKDKDEELRALRSERRKLLRELAIILDIPYRASSSMGSVCV